jgi:enamine deaminase RidA (YjgF/YER057c/UK114 family)
MRNTVLPHIRLTNPEDLYQPSSYVHVAVASGSRTVYLAGQVARDRMGEIVGHDDLAAQTEQAYLNVAAALRSVDADFNHVVKLTVYVVGLDGEKTGAVVEGAARAGRLLGVDPIKPGTLIGVAALTDLACLVEVDAIAVLP